MKKIALLTTNKILAESLKSAIKSIPNLKFKLILLLDPKQALLDAEILQIDIAMIDMRFTDILDYNLSEKEKSISFYKEIIKILPNCKILLFVSQGDDTNRKIAAQAKRNKLVDDYMFYDSSLKYLIAKLRSYG